MKGGDHSTGGAIIGGSLRAAGYRGVVRYASAGRGDVNISPAEARDLRANGIDVGIVNEHQADYLLGGYGVGRQRAYEARGIARACGLPDGVVYMAADFDATNGGPTSPGSPGYRNMQAIAQALHGAADGIGPENVGFYGSYFGMVWLIEHEPWIRWYWQTLAWSKGLLHPRRNLFQFASSNNVGGVDVDLDDLVTPNWGQRGAPSPPPPPPPPQGAKMIASETNHDGRLETLVLRDDGTVWHRWQNTAGSPWVDGWHPLGAPGKGRGIALSRNESGRLEAFVYLLDGSVKHSFQNEPGGSWFGENPKDPSAHAQWLDLGKP